MSEAETPTPGGQDAPPEGAPSAPTEPAPKPTPAPPPAAWSAPPPPPAAGMEGFVFADVPNRIIALIIDAIILFVVTLIVGIVLTPIFGPESTLRDPDNFLNDLFSGDPSNLIEINYVRVLVNAVVGLAISAAYFVYTWTRMRGTFGMKALGMQVGNYPDGKTLTQDQAIRRWAALWGPSALAQFLSPLPVVGGLLGLAVLVYIIYLLYSTVTSPTKQGFHDKFANTAVVKASRVV